MIVLMVVLIVLGIVAFCLFSVAKKYCSNSRSSFDQEYAKVFGQLRWIKLELEKMDYKERAKIATQLSRCRQKRRECKDTVEILEPLVQFLDTDKGKTLFNLMREVLGKTRKVEERMETRIYVPRVLNSDTGKS